MNELLLILMAVVSSVFVFASWKVSKERLYGVIIVFLILIATVGGKIVEFFGHPTNAGNIFYASVFLATYFIIERYGRQKGIYSIWIGSIAVIFFSILAYFAIILDGSYSNLSLSSDIAEALSTIPRVAFASILAYIASQNLNVYLYLVLKKRTNGKYLWLRANISNAVAQVLDSVLFFILAFWGTVPFSSVIEILITGFVIKVVYMMLASLLLYLNRIEEEEEPLVQSITLH